MSIGEFAEAVATYCLIHGGSITSWGRTTLRNKAVGGVPGSSHRFWRGADVVYDSTDVWKDPNRIEYARRLGLKIIAEGDHDHLQPLDWSAG